MDRHKLQDDLLAVFVKHGVSVAVGLTRTGVSIRSQDERVDAANIGRVDPMPLSGASVNPETGRTEVWVGGRKIGEQG